MKSSNKLWLYIPYIPYIPLLSRNSAASAYNSEDKVSRNSGYALNNTSSLRAGSRVAKNVALSIS